ncbi:BON domain-containing protein [Phenylobacterium sp.]|uniref:BON domain-containing protein n=1 Tax=Phenylobacterium sp. TaxID=1871053 RepID=UPI0025DC85B7|nr:BON domain-containing protein [Phenylobacterium sp.]
MADHQGLHAGKGPRGWTLSDSRLIEQISDRLMEDRLLDATDIEVAADAGVVTLTGEAPGASDVAHAEMLTRQTAGVRDVVNRIRFRPGPRAVDRLRPEEEPNLNGRWGRWVPPFVT